MFVSQVLHRNIMIQYIHSNNIWNSGNIFLWILCKSSSFPRSAWKVWHGYNVSIMHRTALKWNVFVTWTSVEQVLMLEIQIFYEVFYTTDICSKNCDKLIERWWAGIIGGELVQTGSQSPVSTSFLLIQLIFKLKIHRMSDNLPHQIPCQNTLSMLIYTTSLHIGCHMLLTSTA